MAVLRLFPLILIASCYSPDVSDCTVACTKAGDCAPSQVCGNDGFCAASTVAGTCAMIVGDAGVDGPRMDAPKPPTDAPPEQMQVKLFIRIDGRGKVSVPTVGECDGGNGGTDCEFDVTKNVPVTLHAAPKNDWRFERWQDACDGQPTATCILTPTQAIQVRARFEEIDDD